MCAPTRWSRCADAAGAREWWGSPFLAPRDPSGADYVLQHEDGRFRAGDGERYVPSSIGVVLTFGGPTARTGDTSAVVGGGGIVVFAERTVEPQWVVTKSYPVRIRGHDGRAYDSTSPSTGRTTRVISWDVRDGGSWVRWRVIDDGEHHTFKEVVAIVEALVET